MKFIIRKILLWPKNKENAIRELRFEPDKINIITGQSQTGKSSIISIIDYCLGSSKCTIPVGIIREKVEWFGLLIEMDDHEILIARKEPGKQIQTSELYLQENNSIQIPSTIEKNSNVEALKRRLNQISNLSALDLSNENVDSYFKSNASSFRDFAAFNFQPQHIVANPYTLFFKADTYEHQEKLKAIFPLALSVIDSHTIAIKHQLKQLEKDLNLKKRELENRKRINEMWKDEIDTYFTKAIVLGLLNAKMDENDGQKENLLRDLLNKNKIHLHEMSSDTTDKVIQEITKINYEETEVLNNIQRYRYKLSKLNEIIREKKELKETLEFKEKRLSPTEWLIDNLKENSICPFCGSANISSKENLVNLKNELSIIINEKIKINDNNTVLDKEMLETTKLLQREELRLNEIRRHKKVLEGKSEKVKEYQETQNQIYRLIGNIEKSFENMDSIEIDSTLVIEIENLERDVNALKAKLVLLDEDEKLRTQLHNFTTYIKKYLEILDVEKPDDEVELDIKDLTLKILSDSRIDYLWEIGSGANWMGYHISALLALHELFLHNPNNPVPSFLVLDQPSQVYFPDIWPGDPDPKKANEKDENEEIKIESDDIRRVKNIFKSLSKHLDITKHKNQIILIDHADEITWDSIKDINLVGRWREKNDFLIPNNWK